MGELLLWVILAVSLANKSSDELSVNQLLFSNAIEPIGELLTPRYSVF